MMILLCSMGAVSPVKLGAVLDTALWKDVDRKVARLIIAVRSKVISKYLCIY